ncbi:MAG TPA: DUF1501 domain-containing protein [Allosphingosinicella sp.]|nr:DUF1501 domain-containing protein [Allosphingosinicella sp.]
MIDRRFFLGSAAAGAALLAVPGIAFARAATDKRFVFIIQRGAADGLSIVAPVGDPAFTGLRAAFVEDAEAGAKLGGFFTLHPALAETAKLYGAGEALFVHAVASPYRDRSHFDGQNVLETGATGAYRLKDGWMNRLLGLLPQGEAKAIAVSPTVPMALRGAHDVTSYAPSNLPAPADDLLARVGDLYARDPQLAPLWNDAMATRKLTGDLSGGGTNGAATGALAARLLAGADGERVAFIETGGWDTHSGQRGRLAAQLKGLDALLAALKTGLGADWANTLVLVATEFGRTAAINGTGGTDHGTASVAMLLGGAVNGGRVSGDWPGLAPAALYQNRDLRPTTDLDALIANALGRHYGLDLGRTAAALFPEGKRPTEIEGLIRAA